MDNNLTLTLEALASCGCVLSSEHRSGLDISLKVKRVDAGLQTLALWGRIFTTTGKDYILAEGCASAKRIGRKLNFDVKYYFRYSETASIQNVQRCSPRSLTKSDKTMAAIDFLQNNTYVHV